VNARSAPIVDRPAIMPRPVFCITKDVHNDRAVAEEVCAGRFTHAGITLDLGTDPDWLAADLPSDEEWRIEWSKFYYGLDLASAFAADGDVRFLHAWEQLVHSWIRKVGVGSDPSDVAARRMQNWTYAWSIFASAPNFPGLSDDLDDEILGCLTEHAHYVRSRLTEEVFRNHRTLELYALFIVALAFPQIDRSSALLRFAISELHRTLREAFESDGVHRENSTHYHLVVLRSFLGARENVRRFELDVPDDFDALLERACDFALHCQRPDGVIPALSDADSAAYPEVLNLAASLLNRSDFGYAATAGREGTAPRRRYVTFPASGYFVQRSGWGTRNRYVDERFLIFDCGPLGMGGHGHYDLLNVEIYAHGRPLIVDPGRYTYAEEGENLRRWFKGTAAHNTVCVDGLDQTPYRRGRPGKHVATGSPAPRLSAPGFDVLEGRAESPCYDAVHTRRIFFVGDEYWIVEDTLEAERSHKYDLRWHLSSEAWASTEVREAEAGPVVVAPGVALAFAGSDEIRLEPGWVSPKYGVKDPAPVVSVTARGSDVRFLTVITPLGRGRKVPRLRMSPRDGSTPTIVELEGVGDDSRARDAVAWSPRPTRLPLGTLQCTASAAWVRELDGHPVRFRGFGVTEISSVRELHAIEAINPDGWMAWDAGRQIALGRGAEQ
jgi:hypothetical protein